MCAELASYYDRRFKGCRANTCNHMPRRMSMLQLGMVLGARSKPKPDDYVAARQHVATWYGVRLQVEADA